MGNMAGRFSFSSPDRNRSNPWFSIGDLDVTTSVLVAGLSVISLVVAAIDVTLLDPLILFASDVRHGQVWRLVTWPVVTIDPTIWTIITIALFWYFGREIEAMLGRNRFAWFLGIIVVVPAIVATVIDLNVAGLRYPELAMILIFIAQYPQARFFFNIPGWVIGAVIIGLEVLQLLGARNDDGLLFLAVLLATTALAARSFGLLSSLNWIPQLPLPDAISGTRSSGPRRSARGKVRGRGSGRRKGKTVVDGPWTAPSPPAPPNADTAAAQAELDILLDKISAGGLDSLTTDEKRRLNELSKRLR